MIVFTEVDGQSYQGVMKVDVRQLANLSFVREMYISAHGPFGVVAISALSEWDDPAPDEMELRGHLADAIRKKMKN